MLRSLNMKTCQISLHQNIPSQPVLTPLICCANRMQSVSLLKKTTKSSTMYKTLSLPLEGHQLIPPAIYPAAFGENCSMWYMLPSIEGQMATRIPPTSPIISKHSAIMIGSLITFLLCGAETLLLKLPNMCMMSLLVIGRRGSSTSSSRKVSKWITVSCQNARLLNSLALWFVYMISIHISSTMSPLTTLLPSGMPAVHDQRRWFMRL
mmetsp:Transcript_501/g.1506  ORF Transcript_501/g.1506 Transcript_501/m.1506 type:complete len:208 (-) Transcript_501:832-1455(-)